MIECMYRDKSCTDLLIMSCHEFMYSSGKFCTDRKGSFTHKPRKKSTQFYKNVNKAYSFSAFPLKIMNAELISFHY